MRLLEAHPRLLLLLEAVAQYDVDLKTSDIAGTAGATCWPIKAAGCRAIFVDYGLKQDRLATPDKIVSSLAEAVDFILARA